MKEENAKSNLGTGETKNALIHEISSIYVNIYCTISQSKVSNRRAGLREA